VRVVINTIALESISEVLALLKELEITDADIVQVSASRSRQLGRYHMMTGLNPVYIVSFG
jgi:precorrin-6Y C5,15-methyltransferase (decarboxylating)